MGRNATAAEDQRWSPGGDRADDRQNATPPCDVLAEQQFLGSCCLAPELVNGHLRPGDFFDDAHRVLYAAMLELRDGGKPIDAVLLADALKRRGHWETSGGSAYMAKVIASVATAAHAPAYIDLILEKSRLRRLWKLGMEVLDQVEHGLPPDDIEALPETFVEMVKGERAKQIGVPNMTTIIQTHTELRRPVLHGLLREGETLNLIAAAKQGKSWLVYSLLLSVITGRRWLGTFLPVPGRCLLVDNELHPETVSDRIPRVAKAMELADGWADQLDVLTLRGRLEDIHAIGRRLAAVEPGTYKVVVIDALYRALPPDCDENNNADMAAVYNSIDGIADKLQCSFVLVHHATKGNQSAKATTDVGSGAGAISRAVDSHFILRPHQENNVVVVDGALRSWSPIDPFCLRWDFPLWTLADDLDPSLLRKDKPRRASEKDKDSAPSEPGWDAERFAAEFITATPQVRAAVTAHAMKAGLSEKKADTFLRQAVAIGKAFRWPTDDRREFAFASVKPPENTPENAPKTGVSRRTKNRSHKCRSA